MARTLKSDRTLFGSTLLLVAASVIMVYSASALQADKHPSYYYLMKQGAWAMIGLVAMLGIMRMDYHVLRKPEVIWPLVGLVVVGLLAVFVFKPVKGAQRWIPL